MSIKKNEKKQIFWDYDDKGKVVISHSRLISFLRNYGFVNVKLSESNYVLAAV